MSGLGSHLQTYAALREAIEAHAREAYGEEYVLQDFVMIGFVVSMSPDDIDKFEYLMASKKVKSQKLKPKSRHREENSRVRLTGREVEGVDI